MDLDARVAEVERRLAALERAVAERPAPEDDAQGREFQALEALRAQLAELGAENGGVQFAGSVRVPAGSRHEWQYGLTTDALLDGDWESPAEVLAALGRPVRLRLLHAVLCGRTTAAELAELDETGTTGQIYHHLRQLTAAGWLRAGGRGRYEVPADRVVPLLVMLAAAGR